MPSVTMADGQDDPYDADHPQAHTLLLASGPRRAPALDADINAIEELELLQHETS